MASRFVQKTGAGLVILGLILAASKARAQVQVGGTYGDIKVVVSLEPKGEGTHGYSEYGFTLTNSSEERSHQVTLTLPSRTQTGYGDYIRAISRTVEVPEKSTVRVSLFQPATPGVGGEGVAVHVDGRLREPAIFLQLRNTIDPHFHHGRVWGGMAPPGFAGNPPLVLVSPDIGEPFVDGAPAFGRPEGWVDFVPAHYVKVEGGARGWSTHWLGFSRYDGVVLTVKALADMAPESRTALWQYVECGGSLTVLGTALVLPEGWRKVPTPVADVTLYHAGFGQCSVVGGDTAPPRWRDGALRKLVVDSWTATEAPFRSAASALEANKRFPVVADIGIPVRGLFILMLCFGILIGPVNLTLLARWKRRIWMIWTVPVISATTCAAVFGFMIVVEGWSGHLRTETITILDETSHRAATIGWTGFYTPLTPGEGLRFDDCTELTFQHGAQQNAFGPPRSGSGKACLIDWSDGQHLSKGWVTARVPSHFKVRKNEVRRERVSVQRTEEGLSVVNGLGFEVRQLWLVDEEGRLHRAETIAAGARASLEPTDRRLETGNQRASLRQLYVQNWIDTKDWHGKRADLDGIAQRCLPRLSYVAEVDGSPFVEDGLPGARDRKVRSLVIGLLKGIEKGP